MKKLFTVKWYDAMDIEHATPELELKEAVNVLHACFVSKLTGYLLHGNKIIAIS